MCVVEESKKFKEFNNRQKEALYRIISDLDSSIEKIEYKVGYWEKDTFIIKSSYDSPECLGESHDWLNYYWAEYTKDNENYRITMYIKDFDHDSGNIHVYPGGIQIWKKQDCSECPEDGYGKNGFCKSELSVKINKNSFIYSMSGGKPYCEFGWKPLLKEVFFWNDEVLNDFIEALKNGNYLFSSKELKSSEFYKDVIGYSDKGNSGHPNRYYLFKFNSEYRYYKTMLVDGLGYFTKYDGEEVGFLDNGNPKGPNYVDIENRTWVIVDNQYVAKEMLLI